MGQRGEVYTDRLEVGHGRRNYFFNVKTNRNGDYFLNIVESIRKLGHTFERQEIVVYQEHLELFREKLDSVIKELYKISPQVAQEDSDN